MPPALVIGGSFTLAGAAPVSNLALWDGVEWFDVGGGVSGTLHGATAVNALAVLPNGDLVVGSAFDTAGTGGGQISAACIARFNGSTWSRMQAGLPQFASTVLKLGTRPNGALVALGGFFVNDDNTTCGPLAKWNDITSARWTDLPSSQPNFQAYRTFAILANGDVVAGGVAGSAAGSSALWRWNDNQNAWTGFGSGVNGTDPRWQVLTILEASNGDIVAAGNFLTAGGVPANSIARWDGSQWFPCGSGITYPSQVFRLAVGALARMPDGDIVGGGERMAELTAAVTASGRRPGMTSRVVARRLRNHHHAVPRLFGMGASLRVAIPWMLRRTLTITSLLVPARQAVDEFRGS